MPKLHAYRTPFIVGLPVMPNRFFGRQEQVEQFFGQCILGPALQPTRVLGLKRSGKTSFLHYVSDNIVRQQFLTQTEFSTTKFAYINTQTVHSRNEFYSQVADSIQDQIAGTKIDPPEFKSGRAFEKWLDAALQKDRDLKVIVLIDEFEKLNEIEDCDIEFFGFLRALASGRQASFTWVTASAVDLYTLDKSQKTSPLWNIFHQMPIIMGSFTDQEADSLIRDSLKTVGSSITKNEISDIIELAGRIPYFIQAVADAWHKLRENKSIAHSKMKRAVLDVLSNPSNQIQHIYEGYWNEMNENRRAILKNIAGERRNFAASPADLSTLSDYGLIVNDKRGAYTISGQLLKQFIMDVEAGNISPSSSIHIDARGGTVIGGNVRTDGGSFIGHDQINSGVDAKQLFELIYEAIDKKAELEEGDKTDLKQDVQELQQELSKDGKTNQSYVMRRLRNIGRMAPDILEVTLATLTNPAAGFGIIAKKIADKAKETAGK